MIYRLILFLTLNFLGLFIGSQVTRIGANSDWYYAFNKAPWTPPGWMFGVVWSFIMICFSVYMMYAWKQIEKKTRLVILFIAQWVLSVGWNFAFFKYHQVGLGLFVISGLTLVVSYFLFYYYNTLEKKTALILPYFLWLLIATSLNGYIYWMN